MPVGRWSSGEEELCIRENGVGWLRYDHLKRFRMFWMSEPKAGVCFGRWMHFHAVGGNSDASNDYGSIVVRTVDHCVTVSANIDRPGELQIDKMLEKCPNLPVPVPKTTAEIWLGLVVDDAGGSGLLAKDDYIQLPGKAWFFMPKPVAAAAGKRLPPNLHFAAARIVKVPRTVNAALVTDLVIVGHFADISLNQGGMFEMIFGNFVEASGKTSFDAVHMHLSYKDSGNNWQEQHVTLR